MASLQEKTHILFSKLTVLEGDTPNTAGHGCMRHVELRWFIRVWNEQCFDRATVEHKMPVRMYQRTPFQTRCAQRAQTPPRPLNCCREVRWRPLASENVSYLVMLREVKSDRRSTSDSDRHQNLIISRGSPLAHDYHVWFTSVNAFVSYSAHRQNDRQTDRQTDSTDRITPPW